MRASSEQPETRKRRLASIGLWVLTVLEFLGMGLAGLSKFQGDGWLNMFEGWGYPAWFALFIGGAEVILATLLLVPRVASYAALGLIVIMMGAIFTVLTNESQMGPGVATVHILVLTLLAWARWPRRWGGSR